MTAERLRLANDVDGPAMQVILRQVFAEYEGCYFDEGEASDLLLPASSYAAKRGSCWVLEVGSRVAGFVAMTGPGGDGWVELKRLYLLAAARGQGRGRRLIERVEGEARGRGAQGVDLWSDTRFTTAHRVYERCGYLRAPETRDLGDLSATVEYHYTKALR